eukprot:6010904-Prymnesium_polylepis.1
MAVAVAAAAAAVVAEQPHLHNGNSPIALVALSCRRGAREQLQEHLRATCGPSPLWSSISFLTRMASPSSPTAGPGPPQSTM